MVTPVMIRRFFSALHHQTRASRSQCRSRESTTSMRYVRDPDLVDFESRAGHSWRDRIFEIQLTQLLLTGMASMTDGNAVGFNDAGIIFCSAASSKVPGYQQLFYVSCSELSGGPAGVLPCLQPNNPLWQ